MFYTELFLVASEDLCTGNMLKRWRSVTVEGWTASTRSWSTTSHRETFQTKQLSMACAWPKPRSMLSAPKRRPVQREQCSSFSMRNGKAIVHWKAKHRCSWPRHTEWPEMWTRPLKRLKQRERFSNAKASRVER